jgi:hypothetical protein
MMSFFQQLWFLYLLLMALSAWIAFAQHPTAQNLRLAIINTMAL